MKTRLSVESVHDVDTLARRDTLPRLGRFGATSYLRLFRASCLARPSHCLTCCTMPPLPMISTDATSMSTYEAPTASHHHEQVTTS